MGTRLLIAGAALAAFLVAAQPASAIELVDDDGAATAADCNTGAPGSAFTTVPPAVSAATAGETIQVCPGTYSGLVTVNKSVTLLGAQSGVDARGPSRGAAGTESVLTGTGSSGFTPLNVTANNVTIDGFTVEGNTSAAQFGYGILLGAGTTGQAIRNNIVQNNIVGLSLGSDNTTIERNVFRNNNQPGPAAGPVSTPTSSTRAARSRMSRSTTTPSPATRTSRSCSAPRTPSRGLRPSPSPTTRCRATATPSSRST